MYDVCIFDRENINKKIEEVMTDLLKSAFDLCLLRVQNNSALY